MYYPFDFWWTLLLIVAAMAVILGTDAYLILLERKVSAWVQDRIGPNRVGPFGLLQPIADGLKFLLKEQIVPRRVDRLFYLLAPGAAAATALLAFAVVPFGQTTAPPRPKALAEGASQEEHDLYQYVQREFETWSLSRARGEELPEPKPGPNTKAAARPFYVIFAEYHRQLEAYNAQKQFIIAPRLDIGILFTFAVSSLTVYGIILGGWSSNNKYSLLGALRSSAQIISYEIPMGMSVLGVVLLSKSLNLERVIDRQVHGVWFVFYQPLAFVLFLTSIFAECNRLPFDLPEAEQELVGGYHTEYSGMKFAMFFLGEYTHMITTSFLAVVLFFGGWHFPGLPESGAWAVVLKLLVFAVKMALFIVFYMLVRWTIPRFRFDQLMGLAWKVLIPLALVNLLAVMVVQHLIEVGGWHPAWKWALLPASLLLLAGVGLLTLRRPMGKGQPVLVTRGHEQVSITVR